MASRGRAPDSSVEAGVFAREQAKDVGASARGPSFATGDRTLEGALLFASSHGIESLVTLSPNTRELKKSADKMEDSPSFEGAHPALEHMVSAQLGAAARPRSAALSSSGPAGMRVGKGRQMPSKRALWLR
jgi:hypothetical protein